MFHGYAEDFSSLHTDLQGLPTERLQFNAEEFQQLLKLADTHHVTVRALRVLGNVAHVANNALLEEWCEAALAKEQTRIANAVEWLNAIVQCLEDCGCPVCVIKSLDHWPDLGSDLDLYTNGTPEQVVRIMCQKLRGEQELMARRVLERRVSKTVNGHTFPVPAAEERVLISTLQRMYRHFYFRLCDMADMAALIRSGSLDFGELRRGAELGSIWPGVASFLVIVAEYAKTYGGQVDLPGDVIAAAYSRDLRVQFRDTFLRVPLRPAAGLYSSQLFAAGRHGDMRAITRLPLLPPLAVSAWLAYQLTGSDKGVW